MKLSVKNEDIEILTKTYLQLFSSILSKQNIDVEQKRKTYKNLQTFLSSHIKTADDFPNHIQEYAKILSTSDTVLSNYLGNNFQKALDYVKGKITPSPDGASPVQKIQTAQSIRGSSEIGGFLRELIEKTGIQITPGSRFIPVDLGVMKLVENGSETIGTSGSSLLQISNPVQNSAKEDTSKKSSTSPQIIKHTIPSRNEKKIQIMEKEQSIIEEILIKFGNVLDIHEKLVPRPDVIAENESPATKENSGSENKTAPAQGAATAAVIPARSPAKKVISLEKETSIISEILLKFGNVLDIHEKLIPKSGISETNAIEENTSPGEIQKEIFSPIISKFQEYYSVIKIIRDFQVKGDRSGYTSWLNGADPSTRAIVNVRNANLKYRKGLIFDLKEELDLSCNQLGFSTSSLEDLNMRMAQFEKIQVLLGNLLEDAKGQGTVFVNSFRPVWGEIQLLFDKPETLPKTQFALKKILKKVASPAMRSAMEELVIPYLKKASQIYNIEGKSQLRNS